MEQEVATMRRKPDPQNDDALPSGAFPTPAAKKAHVRFSLISARPYLAFAMTDVDGSGVVGGNEREGYYLAIDPGDSWLIRMTLDSSLDWQFDKDPISLKRASDAKYYKVVSQSADEVIFEAHSRLSGPIPKPWPENINPFTLYVAMGQSAVTRYKVGIDPDLRNPPR